MKRCARCKQIKSEEEFGKNKNRKDGLQHTCKKCRKEYYQIPEIRTVHLESCKIYKRSINGKLVTNKTVKKRRNNHPNFYKATNAVNNAVRDGKLPKASTQKCGICNNRAKDYHHNNYEPEHWLDVIPLCRQCHVNIHKAMVQ